MGRDSLANMRIEDLDNLFGRLCAESIDHPDLPAIEQEIDRRRVTAARQAAAGYWLRSNAKKTNQH
jgi:hypothetical protein